MKKFKSLDGEELELYGEHIGDQIGAEVKKLIDTAYLKAQTILAENRDKLEEIANVLIQKEKITAEEFEKFFKM